MQRSGISTYLEKQEDVISLGRHLIDSLRREIFALKLVREICFYIESVFGFNFRLCLIWHVGNHQVASSTGYCQESETVTDGHLD